MKNEIIINTINSLLSGYKKLESKGIKRDIQGVRYLLGQSIRQYNIPIENYHISKCAKDRWEELTNDSIDNYWYRKKVVCDKLQTKKRYKLYSGSRNNGKETDINPGDSFIFRDMFHEEHIIPVSLIMDKMIKEIHGISKKKAIKDLLDRMHICVILKEEDRMINQKSGKTANRTDNFEDNVENVYKKQGITLLSFRKYI